MVISLINIPLVIILKVINTQDIPIRIITLMVITLMVITTNTLLDLTQKVITLVRITSRIHLQVTALYHQKKFRSKGMILNEFICYQKFLRSEMFHHKSNFMKVSCLKDRIQIYPKDKYRKDKYHFMMKRQIKVELQRKNKFQHQC